MSSQVCGGSTPAGLQEVGAVEQQLDVAADRQADQFAVEHAVAHMGGGEVGQVDALRLDLLADGLHQHARANGPTGP